MSWTLSKGFPALSQLLGVSRRCALHTKPPIVHIPKSNVYRFDDTKGSNPIFRDFEWTVNDGESWAVVGSGSGEKTMLLETLQGNFRIKPPPHGGISPFLPVSSHTSISLVSFAHRSRSSGSQFTDYTARYGAVFEDDAITLRQSMFPETLPEFARRDNMQTVPMTEEDKMFFERLVEKLDLERLLDLPLIALSNGQTRKARILKALLLRPELMLLDEPLTGLDVTTRPLLSSLLHSLHTSGSPRVILGLRRQDPLPEWISHVAFVSGGKVRTGLKDEVADEWNNGIRTQVPTRGADYKSKAISRSEREILVDMKNVNVKYHERHVLKNVNWTIRAGDRWHLQGSNGSGKTTLLSFLTGDHPQSYNQRPPSSELTLFGHPRSKQATSALATRVGIVSPEIYNAFPRRRSMTVWEAIGTGFDGTFMPRGERGVGLGLNGALTEVEEKWRVERVREVIRELGPGARARARSEEIDELAVAETFGTRNFADLPPGEQGVVLLMRALVGRPPLVILDEVWSGMDGDMITAAREYLRGGGVGDDQAVVAVSHWEEEVPWTVQEDGVDGILRFRLHEGTGRVVIPE